MQLLLDGPGEQAGLLASFESSYTSKRQSRTYYRLCVRQGVQAVLVEAAEALLDYVGLPPGQQLPAALGIMDVASQEELRESESTLQACRGCDGCDADGLA